MTTPQSLQGLLSELRQASNSAHVERLAVSWLESRFGRGAVALDRQREPGDLRPGASRRLEVTTGMVMEGIYSHEACLLMNRHFVVEGPPHGLGETERTLLETVTEAFCEAFNRVAHAQEIEPLSGLPGPDSFYQQLSSLMATERLLCLVMLDLDGFGKANQTHGTEYGDRVLAETGTLLTAKMRSQDYAFRLDGDEFALLLPGTLVETATRTAERIREGLRVRGLGTASMGISSWPDRAADRAELLKRAKDARFAAWRLGGDQICLAPPLEVPKELES
jgi:diguanylate cyclase (GGDEF)-like protein